MNRFAAFLAALDPVEGPPLAELLQDLPGLAVHAGRPAPRSWEEEAFGACELSLREGPPAVRLAWSLDPARLAPGSLPRLVQRLGADPAPVAFLGGHLQIGLEGGSPRRVKVYTYPDRQRPQRFAEVLARLAGNLGVELPDAAGVAFAAVDLLPDGGRLKLYRECATVEEALRDLPVGSPLVGVLRAFPLQPGQAPAVVSTRLGPEGPVDTTLHLRLGRVRPEPVAGPQLSERLALLRVDAAALDLRFQPTYLSWLDGPRRARTLYGQLVNVRPG